MGGIHGKSARQMHTLCIARAFPGISHHSHFLLLGSPLKHVAAARDQSTKPWKILPSGLLNVARQSTNAAQLARLLRGLDPADQVAQVEFLLRYQHLFRAAADADAEGADDDRK